MACKGLEADSPWQGWLPRDTALLEQPQRLSTQLCTQPKHRVEQMDLHAWLASSCTATESEELSGVSSESSGYCAAVATESRMAVTSCFCPCRAQKVKS